MPPTLPTNMDGSLRRFTEVEWLAMDIRRRGVANEGDHVIYDLGPDGSGCVRRYSCAWDQRFNAVIYFVGAAVAYVDGDQTKISRLLSQRDPDIPEWVCTKVRISPFKFSGEIEYTDEFELDEDDEYVLVGDDAPTAEPLASFDHAELECTYELVPYNLIEDDAVLVTELERYVTYPGFPGAEISTQTNYIGLPGSILQYATETGTGLIAGRSIPFAVGFPENGSTFRMIWRRVPFDVWGAGTAITERVLGNGTPGNRGYLGSVNDNFFEIYSPLTVQLVGVEQRLLPDPTGFGYSWEITYLFSLKPVPYGHLGFYAHDIKDVPEGNPGNASGYYMALRPSAGQTILEPEDIGDNDSLFPVRNFLELFNPGETTP